MHRLLKERSEGNDQAYRYHDTSVAKASSITLMLFIFQKMTRPDE
jgi:hypothetical protein